MARPSRATAQQGGASYCLANIASGKNADNTDYTVPVSGTVTSAAPTSSAANTPSIATSAGDAIAANANRKQWAIQNVGTNPLFVRLGTGASATVFHFVLKGGTVDSDGLGAMISDDKWTGVVSVAGTSPKYTVTELT